jgi:RNA polymerase sigma-70 factor (ECF subfamily)
MAFVRSFESGVKAGRVKELTAEYGVDFAAPILESQSVTVPPVIDISDDARLVSAAREGNRSAFGELYGKYARVVHGILLSRVPPEDVDDLVHDVFLHAMRNLRSLREAAAFPGWLAAIARNRAADYHRRSRENVELHDEIADEKTPQPEPHAILAAIRSLPEAYSETLMLRLVEGLTGPEIAARTGLTQGSARVNLHRGMAKLREILVQRSGETP